MNFNEKCEADGKGGFQHRHCGGELIIDGKGEVPLSMPVLCFHKNAFGHALSVQDAFTGYCAKCGKQGGFRVSGAKHMRFIPEKNLTDKMMKQLANPN